MSGPETNAKEHPVASSASIIVMGILCVVLVPWTALVSWYSIFLGFASGGCSTWCNYDAIDIGIQVAMWGPIVVAIVAIVLGIWRGVRRRRFSWAFPLAAFLVVIIPFFVGDLIATASNHMPLV